MHLSLEIALEYLEPLLESCVEILPKAGPIDVPTRFRSIVIPRAMPVTCIGTETSITLNTPAIESASPDEIITSPIVTISSVKWSTIRLENTIVLIAVPDNKSRVLPTLFSRNPDIIVTINSTIIMEL